MKKSIFVFVLSLLSLCSFSEEVWNIDASMVKDQQGATDSALVTNKVYQLDLVHDLPSANESVMVTENEVATFSPGRITLSGFSNRVVSISSFPQYNFVGASIDPFTATGSPALNTFSLTLQYDDAETVNLDFSMTNVDPGSQTAQSPGLNTYKKYQLDVKFPEHSNHIDTYYPEETTNVYGENNQLSLTFNSIIDVITLTHSGPAFLPNNFSIESQADTQNRVEVVGMTPSYTVTFTAGANGIITGDLNQGIIEGGNTTPVTAAPDQGYLFDQWSDGNTDNPRTITNVTANINLTALFKLDDFTVNFIAGSNGSIQGETVQSIVPGGSTTSVTAVADEEYEFVKWSDDSTDNPKVITNVNSNITLTAEFGLKNDGLRDDFYTTGVDEALVATIAEGVMINDLGTGQQVELVADTSNGTLLLSADGSFSYTPNTSFDGVDLFQYRYVNGDPNKIATVVIAVKLNDGANREVFQSLTDNSLTEFKQNNDLSSPDISDVVDDFETPSNQEDNFAVRMRALAIAPVTGTYRFYIAADEEAELSFSTLPSGNSAAVIASTVSATAVREWDKYITQESAEINLTAGQIVYLESLSFDGTGNDNLAVGWKINNGPISVIENKYLLQALVAPKLEVASVIIETEDNQPLPTAAELAQDENIPSFITNLSPPNVPVLTSSTGNIKISGPKISDYSLVTLDLKSQTAGGSETSILSESRTGDEDILAIPAPFTYRFADKKVFVDLETGFIPANTVFSSGINYLILDAEDNDGLTSQFNLDLGTVNGQSSSMVLFDDSGPVFTVNNLDDSNGTPAVNSYFLMTGTYTDLTGLSNVQVFIDGQPVNYDSASVGNDLFWVDFRTALSQLPIGNHSIEFRFTDLVGNVSTQQSTINYTGNPYDWSVALLENAGGEPIRDSQGHLQFYNTIKGFSGSEVISVTLNGNTLGINSQNVDEKSLVLASSSDAPLTLEQLEAAAGIDTVTAGAGSATFVLTVKPSSFGENDAPLVYTRTLYWDNTVKPPEVTSVLPDTTSILYYDPLTPEYTFNGLIISYFYGDPGIDTSKITITLSDGTDITSSFDIGPYQAILKQDTTFTAPIENDTVKITVHLEETGTDPAVVDHDIIYAATSSEFAPVITQTGYWQLFEGKEYTFKLSGRNFEDVSEVLLKDTSGNIVQSIAVDDYQVLSDSEELTVHFISPAIGQYIFSMSGVDQNALTLNVSDSLTSEPGSGFTPTPGRQAYSVSGVTITSPLVQENSTTAHIIGEWVTITGEVDGELRDVVVQVGSGEEIHASIGKVIGRNSFMAANLPLVEGSNSVTIKVNKNGTGWDKTVNLTVERHVGGGPNIQFDFNPQNAIKAYNSLYKNLTFQNTVYNQTQYSLNAVITPNEVDIDTNSIKIGSTGIDSYLNYFFDINTTDPDNIIISFKDNYRTSTSHSLDVASFPSKITISATDLLGRTSTVERIYTFDRGNKFQVKVNNILEIEPVPAMDRTEQRFLDLEEYAKYYVTTLGSRSFSFNPNNSYKNIFILDPEEYGVTSTGKSANGLDTYSIDTGDRYYYQGYIPEIAGSPGLKTYYDIKNGFKGQENITEQKVAIFKFLKDYGNEIESNLYENGAIEQLTLLNFNSYSVLELFESSQNPFETIFGESQYYGSGETFEQYHRRYRIRAVESASSDPVELDILDFVDYANDSIVSDLSGSRFVKQKYTIELLTNIAYNFPGPGPIPDDDPSDPDPSPFSVADVDIQVGETVNVLHDGNPQTPSGINLRLENENKQAVMSQVDGVQIEYGDDLSSIDVYQPHTLTFTGKYPTTASHYTPFSVLDTVAEDRDKIFVDHLFGGKLPIRVKGFLFKDQYKKERYGNPKLYYNFADALNPKVTSDSLTITNGTVNFNVDFRDPYLSSLLSYDNHNYNILFNDQTVEYEIVEEEFSPFDVYASTLDINEPTVKFELSIDVSSHDVSSEYLRYPLTISDSVGREFQYWLVFELKDLDQALSTNDLNLLFKFTNPRSSFEHGNPYGNNFVTSYSTIEGEYDADENLELEFPDGTTKNIELKKNSRLGRFTSRLYFANKRNFNSDFTSTDLILSQPGDIFKLRDNYGQEENIYVGGGVFEKDGIATDEVIVPEEGVEIYFKSYYLHNIGLTKIRLHNSGGAVKHIPNVNLAFSYTEEVNINDNLKVLKSQPIMVKPAKGERPYMEMSDELITIYVFDGEILGNDAVQVKFKTQNSNDLITETEPEESASGNSISISYGLQIPWLDISASIHQHNRQLAIDSKIFNLPGRALSFPIFQTYRSGTHRYSFHGSKWYSSINSYILESESKFEYYDLGGRKYYFNKKADGTIEVPSGFSFKIEQDSLSKDIVIYNNDGSTLSYAFKADAYFLEEYKDRYDNKLRFFGTFANTVYKIIDDRGNLFDAKFMNPYAESRQFIIEYSEKAQNAGGQKYYYKYHYSDDNLLTAIETNHGAIVRYGYDEKRRLTEIYAQDETVPQLEFVYEGDTEKIHKVIREGKFTDTFTSSGRITTHTDNHGVVTEYKFFEDKPSLPETVTVKGTPDLVTEYNFDDEHRLTSMTTPEGVTTSYEYWLNGPADSSDKRGWHLPKKITVTPDTVRGDGGVTGNSTTPLESHFTYTDNFFQLLTSRGPDGVTTTREYYENETEDLKKIIYIQQDGSTAEEWFSFNQYGQVEYHTSVAGLTTTYEYYPDTDVINGFAPLAGFLYKTTSVSEGVTYTTYTPRDFYGRATAVINEATNGNSTMDQFTRTDYLYNERGELEKVTGPENVDGNPATRNITEYFYDDRGRLKETIFSNPVLQGNNYSYIQSSSESFYDSFGRLEYTISPVQNNQNRVDYFYENNATRVNAVKTESGAYTHYGYDEYGRNNIVTSNHDVEDLNADNPTEALLPDEAVITEYTFDNDSQVIEQDTHFAEGLSNITLFESDGFGRVVTSTDSVTGYYSQSRHRADGKLVQTQSFTNDNKILSDVSFEYYDAAGQNKSLKKTLDNITGLYSESSVTVSSGNINTQSTISGPGITDPFVAIQNRTNSGGLKNNNIAGINFTAQRAHNNITTKLTPAGAGSNVPNIEVTSNGKVTVANIPELNSTETYFPSGVGPSGKTIDADGKTHTNTLNEGGDVISSTEAQSDAAERTTRSYINNAERISLLLRNDQLTETRYDLAGRVEEKRFYYGVTPSDLESWTRAIGNSYGAITTSMTYDSLGRVYEKVLKDGEVHRYEYFTRAQSAQKKDRLKAVYRVMPGNTLKILRSFDSYDIFGNAIVTKDYREGDTGSCTETVLSYYGGDTGYVGPVKYSGFGQLASSTSNICAGGAVISSNQSIQMSYDSLGRIENKTMPSGDELAFEWDFTFTPKQITLNSANLVTYSRNNPYKGNVTGKSVLGSISLSKTYNSQSTGSVDQMSIGSEIFVDYSHESRGLKDSVKQWSQTASSVTYDGVGRREIFGADGKFAGDNFDHDDFENTFGNQTIDGEVITFNAGVAQNEIASMVAGQAGVITRRGSPVYSTPQKWTVTTYDMTVAAATPYNNTDGKGWIEENTEQPVNLSSIAIENIGPEPDPGSPQEDYLKRSYIPLAWSDGQSIEDYYWRLDLANGFYIIEVAVGGLDDTTARDYQVDVNSTVVVDGENDPENDQHIIKRFYKVNVSEGHIKIGNGPAVNDPERNIILNKLSWVKVYAVDSTYTPPTGPKTFNFNYDSTRGRLLEDDRFTYTWDEFNRITTVTDKKYDAAQPYHPTPESVTYFYDAMGRRIAYIYDGHSDSQEWPDKRLVYDGIHLIEERHLMSGQIIAKYHYENAMSNCPLYVERDTNSDGTLDEKLVVITDDRGTVVGLADESGNIVERAFYNSTGLIKGFNSSDQSCKNEYGYETYRCSIPFGYTGMYKDPFTGMYHTLFRDYDPITSRWLSEDPAGYADGLNLYGAYFNVNFRDVNGQGIKEIWDWLWSGEDHMDRYYSDSDSLVSDISKDDGGCTKCSKVGQCQYCSSVWREGKLIADLNISVGEALGHATGLQKLAPLRLKAAKVKSRRTVEAALVLAPVPFGKAKIFDSVRKSLVLRNSAMGLKVSLAHESTAFIVDDSMNLERGIKNWAVASAIGIGFDGTLTLGKILKDKAPELVLAAQVELSTPIVTLKAPIPIVHNMKGLGMTANQVNGYLLANGRSLGTVTELTLGYETWTTVSTAHAEFMKQVPATKRYQLISDSLLLNARYLKTDAKFWNGCCSEVYAFDLAKPGLEATGWMRTLRGGLKEIKDTCESCETWLPLFKNIKIIKK